VRRFGRSLVEMGPSGSLGTSSMAITILQALFLVECWGEGARFDATLTLGKLDAFLGPRDVRRLANLLPNESKFVQAAKRDRTPWYAPQVSVSTDDFFAAMGAKRIESIDASRFEGATIEQDLNEALPAHLHSQFDVVVDAGTLEHVFNVPMALKNAMEALKVGGHFVGVLPANNWCGHGFYQFSAEFFHRAFSAENGFEISRLLVAPVYAMGKWIDGPTFEVSDPAKIRERVEIRSKMTTSFLVQARKIREERVFHRWPQQSDYAALWMQGPQQQRRENVGTKVQEALFKAPRMMIGKIGGIGRVLKRVRAQRVWTGQCRANTALKLHEWDG
jgi:SAM-dependent methyltransferase